MADFRMLAPFILKWEGGFVNDPQDAGGATMKGVTIGTFTEYRKRKGLPAPTVEDLQSMDLNEWMEIFKSLYWDRWKGDAIRSQSVADILVDWVWASGVWGIKIPQRILGVAQDGIVGPETLSALNACEPAGIFDRIRTARLQYIDDICRSRPANGRFRRGWVNRINDLKFRA